MKLKDLKNAFTLPDTLSVGAMNQGLFLEFDSNDVPANSNTLNLPNVDTYPNVPIYIKNSSTTSPLVINPNGDETIEGSESITLLPREYTILRGIRQLHTEDYWTSERSNSVRPYDSLAIIPTASAGIFKVVENNTGQEFTLTNVGTGSYTLETNEMNSYFANKDLSIYVSGFRFAHIDGGTPDALDVKVYDHAGALADFGIQVNQVEFRFYPY